MPSIQSCVLDRDFSLLNPIFATARRRPMIVVYLTAVTIPTESMQAAGRLRESEIIVGIAGLKFRKIFLRDTGGQLTVTEISVSTATFTVWWVWVRIASQRRSIGSR